MGCQPVANRDTPGTCGDALRALCTHTCCAGPARVRKGHTQVWSACSVPCTACMFGDVRAYLRSSCGFWGSWRAPSG